MSADLASLPIWVWDLLIEVVKHEDLHSGPNDCVGLALDNVPKEARMVAMVLGRIREREE